MPLSGEISGYHTLAILNGLTGVGVGKIYEECMKYELGVRFA